MLIIMQCEVKREKEVGEGDKREEKGKKEKNSKEKKNLFQNLCRL
jgi:hypothetical protein